MMALSNADGNVVDTFMKILDQAGPEVQRLMLFIAVATTHDAWPLSDFRATPPSMTDEQSMELFHSTIRSIPEATRNRVWAEVDTILKSDRRVA